MPNWPFLIGLAIWIGLGLWFSRDTIRKWFREHPLK